MIRKLTIEQWAAIDEAYLDRPLPERRVMWVLITAALALVLPIYVGSPKFASEQAWMQPAFALLPDPKMGPRLYWALFKAVNYVVLPAACIKLALGDSIRAHGLALHRDRRVWALYAGLLLLVLPFVYVAAAQPSFLAKYPRYAGAGASWSQLLLWESAYGFQFAALEFFFRGFLLFALARSMGSAAIFVSMVPYVMIHLRKPLPETLGSIVSGVVLGTLALRTRSIYGGVLVHCGVAWAMDGLALLHDGDLARLLGMR
ncbi:MAG: CPBP family intramembrane glutamic endopeptidase [Myxococcota bacterium]